MISELNEVNSSARYNVILMGSVFCCCMLMGLWYGITISKMSLKIEKYAHRMSSKNLELAEGEILAPGLHVNLG